MLIFGECESEKIFLDVKTITAILLTGLFLFNAAGIQLLLTLLLIQQKHDMSYTLLTAKEQSLELITINEYNRAKFFQLNEKEFFYDSCLYDIKYKEVKVDKIIFHCKKDEKELELLAHLKRIQDEGKENNKKNPLTRSLQKSSQNLYFQNQYSSSSNFPAYKIKWSAILVRYDQPDIFLLTPPPQISFLKS